MDLRRDSRPDLPVLRRRLAEAAAWCSHVGGDGPGARLWAPGLMDATPRTVTPHPSSLWTQLMEAPERTVSMLVERRAQRLVQLPSAPADLRGGRILVAEYDATFIDGASQSESQGLVDADDIPAWDTWIGLVPPDAVGGRIREPHPPLLAWIPASLVARADVAVCVNPVQAITWLDERAPELARSLLERT